MDINGTLASPNDYNITGGNEHSITDNGFYTVEEVMEVGLLVMIGSVVLLAVIAHIVKCAKRRRKRSPDRNSKARQPATPAARISSTRPNAGTILPTHQSRESEGRKWRRVQDIVSSFAFRFRTTDIEIQAPETVLTQPPPERNLRTSMPGQSSVHQEHLDRLRAAPSWQPPYLTLRAPPPSVSDSVETSSSDLSILRPVLPAVAPPAYGSHQNDELAEDHLSEREPPPYRPGVTDEERIDWYIRVYADEAEMARMSMMSRVHRP
jgi:hypothetical protein